jgi:hypothetical protein
LRKTLAAGLGHENALNYVTFPFIVEWLADRARARRTSARRRRHGPRPPRRGWPAPASGRSASTKLERTRGDRGGAREGLTIHGWCADLTRHALPRARFDLVVVSRYLQRDLFADLTASLAPGGVVIYETFTTAQRALGRPPTSPDHLLEPGELRRRFDGFDVLFYEEVLAPDAVARLVARSRS